MSRHKGVATLIALLAPFVPLLVIGAFTGSTDMGTPEMWFIPVVWVLGLAIVWWPRRPDAGGGA